MRKINLSFILSLAFLSSIAVLLSSCNKGDEIESNVSLQIDENAAIKDFLCNGAPTCDHIEIQGNSIIFEGDLAMDKSSILQLMNQEDVLEEEDISFTVPHPILKDEQIFTKIENANVYDKDGNLQLEDRQRIRSYWRFARNTDIGSVKYYILNSALNGNCNNGYETAITNAKNHLNGISNTKINLSRTYNYDLADIVIGCDDDLFFAYVSPDHYDLPPGTRARATPVSTNRKIGKYISINNNTSQSENDKRGTMIHEILHCVGFGHTNGNYYHMYDSPLTDATSIMNSPRTTVNTSYEDKQAIRRLWPTNLEKPVSFTVTQANQNYVRIKFRNPIPTKPYDKVYVAHWYNGNYQPWGIWGHQQSSGGQYDIYWIKNFPPGDHWFYVVGGSHGGEVFSAFSGWRMVSI